MGSSSRIDAVGLARSDQRERVADVLLGAAAQDVGERAALDLEQREEVGVLGHEQHRRLGALAEVAQGGVRSGRAPRPATGAGSSRMLSASSSKRASLLSKYQ